MNFLLPKKEELFPINNSWETFYESSFHDEFDNLSFKEKLKVLNDIVRQSILYAEIPDPTFENETLIGDSYTASRVLIDYMKELKIGKNHRTVLARGRNFDSTSYLSTHFITLVDNDGVTYQIDTTPSIGYQCGKVEMINENQFYLDYKVVSGALEENLKLLRAILYDISFENIEFEKLKYYVEIISELLKYDELKGYILKICNIILKKIEDKDLKKYLIYIYNDINFKNDKKIYINDGIIYKNYNVYKQICLWKEELEVLIHENKNYNRQLDISQSIVNELIKYNKKYDKKLIYNGNKIDYSNISPRFLLEEGLNVVLLKPSAFKLGVSATIRESFLKHGNNAIGEYYPNVGTPSETLGLSSMRLFHPCGMEYERSMNGPGDLFLVKKSADEVKKIKKDLRKLLGKNVANAEVVWYDNEKIVWNSNILNLVHTTDDPCEASLHYLAGYPEYQLMTRFMYPNPKIKELEKRIKR